MTTKQAKDGYKAVKAQIYFYSERYLAYQFGSTLTIVWIYPSIFFSRVFLSIYLVSSKTDYVEQRRKIVNTIGETIFYKVKASAKR